MTLTTVRNIKFGEHVYASDSLKNELYTKRGITMETPVLNIAYTDYGGSFFDKVLIQYLIKHHPGKIVWEHTNWFGKNCLVFGKLATEISEATDRYLLAFEDIEDFYTVMLEKERKAGFRFFLKSIQSDYIIKKTALYFLINEASDYTCVMTSGLDYSERELIDMLLFNRQIKQRVF